MSDFKLPTLEEKLARSPEIAKEITTAHELGDHATILRDPDRVAAIVAEIVEELRRQNCGEGDSDLHGERLEGEVAWLALNMKATRHDFVRACGVFIQQLVHWDIGLLQGWKPTWLNEDGTRKDDVA